MALDRRNQGEIGRVSSELGEVGTISKAMEQVRTWAAAAGLGLLVSINPAMADDKKTEGVQVADASGKIVLANYNEKGRLSPTDIQSGIAELIKGFISEGETPESAKGYAEETLTAFLSGKDDGGVEYIAKFAPKLTKKILSNPEAYQLALALKDEAQIAKDEAQIAKDEAQIAKDEAQIAKAKKAIKELDGATEAIN